MVKLRVVVSVTLCPTVIMPAALAVTALVKGALPSLVISAAFWIVMLLPSRTNLVVCNLPKLIMSPAAELAVFVVIGLPPSKKVCWSASVIALVEATRLPTFTCAVEPNKMPLGLIR